METNKKVGKTNEIKQGPKIETSDKPQIAVSTKDFPVFLLYKKYTNPLPVIINGKL